MEGDGRAASAGAAGEAGVFLVSERVARCVVAGVLRLDDMVVDG